MQKRRLRRRRRRLRRLRRRKKKPCKQNKKTEEEIGKSRRGDLGGRGGGLGDAERKAVYANEP